MRKLLLIIMLNLILHSVAHAQDTVVVSAAPSVYAWQDGETLVGPAVDLFRMISKNIGFRVETRVLPWKRSILYIKRGQLDGILTLFITDERKKFIEFTDYYTQVNTSAFVLKGNEFEFEEWKDLIGKKGVSIRGRSQGKKFDNFSKNNLQLEEASDMEEMVRMLEKGRVEYAIHKENDILTYAIKNDALKTLQILNKPIISNNLYFGFSKKSAFKKHIPKINKMIVEMRNDGIIEQLIVDSIKKTASQ